MNQYGTEVPRPVCGDSNAKLVQRISSLVEGKTGGLFSKNA